MLSPKIITILVTALPVLLYFIYRLLTRPLNRIRRFGDLGFNFGIEKLEGRHRASALDRVRRLRQKGELPPVFPNGWFVIAESDEIRCKEVKPIVVFGEQLTLFRSESGSVHLLNSYCPHVGANFSVGGRVVDNNCIQCPFHGWVFSGESGKCMRIPYNEGTIPEQARVALWPVVERNKQIYVWYDCDGNAPSWEIPEIPEISTGRWSYKGRTEHEIMCHVQEIPENGADVAHLNYLHLTGSPAGHNILEIDLANTKPSLYHIWDGSWKADTEEKHKSVMHLEQVMKLFGIPIPLSSSKLDAIQIGPGIVHMHLSFGWLGEGIVLHHVTPEEPLLQRARFTMYSNLPRWFAKFFMINEANQFERDIYIWSNKKYVKSPLLVRNDGPIGKHRRWYAQFYSENSPRLLPDGTLSNKPKSILDW